MRFLKRILLGVLLYLGIFGIACFIGFYATGNEPVTLITCMYSSAGVELIIMGVMKIYEIFAQASADKKRGVNNNDRLNTYNSGGDGTYCVGGYGDSDTVSQGQALSESAEQAQVGREYRGDGG